MADPKKSPRDRYDVSGNVEAQYVDLEQTVLRNRQGITELAALQAAEEVSLAGAYVEAAKAAFKREYGPLAEIIRQSLARARQRP